MKSHYISILKVKNDRPQLCLGSRCDENGFEKLKTPKIALSQKRVQNMEHEQKLGSFINILSETSIIGHGIFG